EGNAYGLQVTLTRPLQLTRRLGRWTAAWADGAGDVERMHAGAWPRLVPEGFLARGSGWVRALSAPLARGTRRGLRLQTGLLVRPPADTWLRVTSAANRRNTLLDVAEQLIPDDGGWVPLVLDVALRADAPARFRLEGEIACLGALRPGVRVTAAAIADAPELL